MTIRKYLVFCSLLFSAVTSYGDNWKLERDKNGIKVYTRAKEGALVREFKALATIKASRFNVAEVIARISDYPNVFPNCIEGRVIEVISATERKVYYRMDFPWPTSDRDAVMILRVVVNEELHQTTLYFTKTSGTPEVDGVIRMLSSDGYWQLTDNGSSTDIYYQFFADSGGDLPAWVVNMFVVNGPYDAIMALKKKLE